MYVRDAKNREEVWLLDNIEAMGLDDTTFRSRDYVVALDEETNEKAGFGRIRVHKTDDDRFCELTSIGVLSAWRGQGVGAHVVERLVAKAGDGGFDVVYSFTTNPEYLGQFGFEPVESGRLAPRLRERLETKRGDGHEGAVAMKLEVDAFTMPARLREAFKTATPHGEGDEQPVESAEDFGIDPEKATYKYDTSGSRS